MSLMIRFLVLILILLSSIILNHGQPRKKTVTSIRRPYGDVRPSRPSIDVVEEAIGDDEYEIEEELLETDEGRITCFVCLIDFYVNIFIENDLCYNPKANLPLAVEEYLSICPSGVEHCVTEVNYVSGVLQKIERRCGSPDERYCHGYCIEKGFGVPWHTCHHCCPPFSADLDEYQNHTSPFSAALNSSITNPNCFVDVASSARVPLFLRSSSTPSMIISQSLYASLIIDGLPMILVLSII